MKRFPFKEAWNTFIESPEGVAGRSGITSGPYLENRLKRAFTAGWNARENEAVREYNDAKKERKRLTTKAGA